VQGYIDYLKDEKVLDDPAAFDDVVGEVRKKFTRTAKSVKPENRLVDELGTQQMKRDDRKVGRNDPCPCGSGKKYKKCCQAKETA